MSRPRRSVVGAEINVTPLVDVVLVLLIIFMVVMPQAEAGIPLELPGILSEANANKDAELEPVTISVRKDGALFLEKDPHQLASLRAELQGIRSQAPRRKVVIRGDKQAPYAAVRGVFKEAQQLGFPGVLLQVVAKSGAAGAEG